MTNRSADIAASGLTSIMGGEQYRPYPAYKDSGIEWLGEIPTHWEVSATKRVCRITDDRAFGAELKDHLFDQYLRSYRNAEELIKL